MQTEATPREPFTLGVLFRYRLTVITVAFFVILGGYLRIIAVPRLYEATARLAVRFPSEAVTLGGVGREGLFRLPLLEEEVKAYMVQIKSQEFIRQVVRALKEDEEAAATATPAVSPGARTATESPSGAQPAAAPAKAEAAASAPEPLPPEPTALERFGDQLVKTYYNVRRTVLVVLGAILRDEEAMLPSEEEEVLQLMARLEVAAGTEASHIIVVTYRNKDARAAAAVVNKIASKFIESQRKDTMKPKVLGKYEEAADAANKGFMENKIRLFALGIRVGSPTLEDAIKKRCDAIQAMRDLRDQYLLARRLLAQGIISYDRNMPLEAMFLSGELESEYLSVMVRYNELARQKTEEPEFYASLKEAARKHLEERRGESIKRDLAVCDARATQLSEDIERLEKDPLLMDAAPEYSRLVTQQAILQSRVNQAELELLEAKAYNERISDQTIAENVKIWQAAEIPPFWVPQHRGLKLLIVIVLGVFAGVAAAVIRHQVKPKPARRVRPRHEGESQPPLIIMPDGGKASLGKDLDVDISFPAAEGQREVIPGRDVRS